MLSQIADPYIYFSRTAEEDEIEQRRDWKFASSCRKLRYDIKEDAVTLAHTADRLIEDEVRYIRQLADNVNIPDPQPEPGALDARAARQRAGAEELAGK